jgi:N-acetylated-alpha-linked acidic dipeptidase
MRKLAAVLLVFVCSVSPSLAGPNQKTLNGYAGDAAQTELQWESKFQAIPSPANQRAYMQRLSARPHHVGSAYDLDNAQWILARFKEWGLDAHIESFDVLFPTPKTRVVEMVEPVKFTAKLEEPALSIDPTSGQNPNSCPPTTPTPLTAM